MQKISLLKCTKVTVETQHLQLSPCYFRSVGKLKFDALLVAQLALFPFLSRF